MPKIITIANSKGGVGKSTITLNLYNYLYAQGLDCAICDTDLQQSIVNLKKEHITLISDKDIANSKHAFILIDTPPYRTGTSVIIKESDFVLIPVKPSQLDVTAAAAVVNDCQKSGIKYSLVLNMVKPGTKFTDDIKGAIHELGWPLFKTEIYDRVDYARSLVILDSVFDAENEKALGEIRDLTNELFAKMLS